MMSMKLYYCDVINKILSGFLIEENHTYVINKINDKK
jgi:hypothetical protein